MTLEETIQKLDELYAKVEEQAQILKTLHKDVVSVREELSDLINELGK